MIKSNRFHVIAAFLLAAVIALSFLLGSGGGLYAAAASDVVSTYEAQNVLDDLQGTTIDGEKIDLSEYYFDKNKDVKVLSFVEFGYSFNIGKQDDYGLYVYVYNPRGIDFTVNQSLNKISLKYGDKTAYDKYPLNYLNRSTKKGYEGLFYKFKIALTAAQRAEILQTLDKSVRVYDVSEIELYSSGTNATAYEVANTYTYTGYAAGYGSDFEDGKSTLECTSKDSVTLSLDVHGAAYRPEGTNGKNNYTQDMLHSVYFSIPNSYISEYGRMTAVHATWLNALTAPIFVTGNTEVYNALKEYIGDTIPEHKTFRNTCPYGFNSDVAIYNCFKGNFTGKEINSLYYMFKAPNSIADVNKADHYVLKGSEILEYIQNYEPTFGGAAELVAGKYYSELFEKWDSKFTDITIYVEEEFSLTSEKITQSWWEWFMNMQGTQVVGRETFTGIKKIHEVIKADFGNSEAEACKNLYIDKSYYNDFKKFYDEATKGNKTVYLFRYYQSEYLCDEAEENKWNGTNLQPDLYRGLDTNAYVAQEVVSLDFDIIDVTLTKDNVSTVIGVVSSPIDIVPDITPPVNTTPDAVPLWRKIVAVIALVCMGIVAIWFLKWLFGSKKK